MKPGSSRFIRQLIERAEGRAPLLERRQRALFEPRAPWSATATNPMMVEREEPVEAQSRAPRIAGPEQSLPRAIDKAPSPSTKPLAESSQPIQILQGAQPPTTPPLRAAMASAPLTEPRPKTAANTGNSKPFAAPTQVQARQPAAAALPARDVPVAAAQPSKAAPIAKAVVRAEPPARVATRAREEQPEPRQRATNKAPALASLQPVMPAQRVPTRRDSAPAVLLARAQSPSRSTTAAAPSPAPAPVNISIGRVEVRAHSGPPERAARPVRNQGPQLKLDDYLRERSRSGS
jgi:hypothetical protein